MGKSFIAMRKIPCITLVFAALLLLACQNEKPGVEQAAVGEVAGNAARELMLVRQPLFGLREEPGEKGAAMRPLQAGDSLSFMGERSTFSTRIIRHGRQYDEPWLLVQTPSGQQGWAYAAAFESLEEYSALTRLQYLLGPDLGGRVLDYRQALEKVDSAAALAAVLQRTEQLRDTLVAALAGRELNEESLSWLREALPSLAPYPVEEEDRFHLFIDYRFFLHLAGCTPEAADEQFIQTCLMVYPIDSIEYFYPAWSIQPEKGQSHSLLGKGIHYRILVELDKALGPKDLFGEKIGQLRQQIVNDITAAGVTYWEPQEKVLAELDRILEAGLSLLTKANRIALQTRRQQFENPDQYGIKLNYRSGIYSLE